MPGPVNPESMLTMDEMERARGLASSLYQSMLADLDFTEEGPDEQSELSAREGCWPSSRGAKPSRSSSRPASSPRTASGKNLPT